VIEPWTDPQPGCKRVHDAGRRRRFARTGCIESGSTSSQRGLSQDGIPRRDGLPIALSQDSSCRVTPLAATGREASCASASRQCTKCLAARPGAYGVDTVDQRGARSQGGVQTSRQSMYACPAARPGTHDVDTRRQTRHLIARWGANESAVDTRGAQPQGQVLTVLTPVDKRGA